MPLNSNRQKKYLEKCITFPVLIVTDFATFDDEGRRPVYTSKIELFVRCSIHFEHSETVDLTSLPYDIFAHFVA